MAKRKKKVVSELDESIIRELKKNRIFSKINTYDIPDDKFQYALDTIEALRNSPTKYVYIMDNVYPDSDLNFLVSAPDSAMLVINNDDLFDELYKHDFNLTDDLIIKYIKNNELISNT